LLKRNEIKALKSLKKGEQRSGDYLSAESLISAASDSEKAQFSL
jgi:hypothetical protein